MKLPNNISRRKKFTLYVLSYYVLISVMFAPIPQIYASSGFANNFSLIDDNPYSNNDFKYRQEISFDSIISQDIRPEELGYPYIPQTQSGDTSDQFSATDYLTVSHSDTLSLTNFDDTGKINNSFSISNIDDYSNDSLNYGISSMTSIADYYTIEDEWDGYETLKVNGYYSLAQEFVIEWDYAMFYDSQLILSYDNIWSASLDLYQLELFLVNASSVDGKPDMSSIITSCTNDPFSQSNPYTDIGFQSFDFPNVKLAKGSYFIVANLSVIDADDAPKHFTWLRNNHASDGVDGGKTYFRHDGIPGVWSGAQGYDFALLNNLLPCDNLGSALTFATAPMIDLNDNGLAVSSNTAAILSTGAHDLVANTSVQITFNNTYTFTKTYSGDDILAAYSAINGSYWSYSVDWNINWTTPLIDISPYSNLDRYQIVFAPSDWHDSAFMFYFDETEALTGLGSRTAFGYRVDLGNNNSASNWLLSTKSPNYLSDLVLMDDTTPTERFLLGYWIGTATQSIGYTGSKIVANTLVQGGGIATPYNVTTGSLNFTIYDGNGNIIPIKSGLPANLVYTDTSSYTLAGITQVSDGFFTPEIYFDPSAYGTDEPGFWTAAVMWQNGTQVGFYSQRIVVQTQTQFDFVWEEEPSNNNWITDDISRKGLDSIDLTGYYFNVSEPYTTGERIPISTATVSYNVYNGTWNTNDDFTYEGSAQYNSSISVDFAVGTYTVDIIGTGAFIEANSTSFSLTVFYELAVNSQFISTTTNYTDDAIFYIALYDVTGDTNLSFYSDLNVTLYDGGSYYLTEPADYTFIYSGALEIWILDISTTSRSLDTGVYDVYFSIFINNYRANYSSAYVSDVYTFEITAPPTEIIVDTAPTTIYVYHSATFEFRYRDLNHSLDLVGAVVTPTANVSGINMVVTPVGDTYQIQVTNNNDLVSAIRISVTVTLANYESQIDFILGDLEVLLINTELVELVIYTPEDTYVGYETSVVIQFNDLTHTELISDAYVKLFICNSSSYTNVSLVEIASGRYNFTFINYDASSNAISITITLAKNGYNNASVTIELTVVSKATSADFDSGYSADIDIYFEQGVTVGLLYWDSTLVEYISQPDLIQIEGNITVTFGYTNISDTIIININPIGTIGYFYLNITLFEPGFAPQMLQVFITVHERTTYLEAIEPTEVTDYASEEIDLLFEYKDGIAANTSILTANVIADFAAANSTLDINTYFDSITISVIGDYIRVRFNPNTALAVGTLCIIELTFEEYGYVTKVMIVQLSFYPPVDYDMGVEIEGELRQLDSFRFVVTIENATQELLSLQGCYPIHLTPDPDGDTVIVYYTFYYKDGSNETLSVSIELSGALGIYSGRSVEITVPWQVIGMSYYAEYIPSAANQDVLLSKSTQESQVIDTASPTFLALLTFLFAEFTYYMVGGLLALAIIFIVLTIYFAVIRPKKQKKKATKRKYLDKISKILTSVLAMRKVIIVHQETGLPIYEWDLGGEITVDSSLVTGFLQAVAGMGSEISGGQAGTVRKLDYGQFVVSSSAKDCICAYLFSTSDVSVDVETGLAKFVEWFEKRFQTVLHDWTGITDEFQKNAHQIMDTLSEELFIWTLHPLSINPMKEKEVVKLSPLSQRIFKFIKDYKEVTISVALEYFNKIPLEETLSTLFNLTDEQFLLRMRLR